MVLHSQRVTVHYTSCFRNVPLHELFFLEANFACLAFHA
jgi:hypothetical protein